ncbi:MAG: hypothetical protein HC822_03635 [Oscillochloris sp.]|nr:hypothetical protein [Oscillochloris sp.]
MTHLTATFIPTLLAFACGIFIVLSLVEKPVWRLMWNPQTQDVPDETARLIHAALKRVVHLLPPIMMTTMASILLLLLAQAWLADFSWQTIAVLVVFVGSMAGVVAALKKGIDGLDRAPSDGAITTVRAGLGAVARLHHQSLLAAAVTLIVHYALVAPGA